MAKNGPQTLDDQPAVIYADEDGCTSYMVRNLITNVANVLVCIPSLHGDEWFHLEPGQEEVFRVGDENLHLVKAKAASGTVDILKGVVAKTN